MSHLPLHARRLLLLIALALSVACGGSNDGAPPPPDSDALDTDLRDPDGELTDDPGDDVETPPAPRRGPGLGNLRYEEAELFQPIGWVNEDTGVPGPDPDFIVTRVKPFGANVAYMHNGYLLVLFAPDSGSGPGGLLFYDVSDPRDPRLVHRVYDPHGITGEFREAHSIGFGNFDGRQHAAFHTGRGIEIWDLNNVFDPRPLSRLALPGVNAGDYLNVAWQHFWQGDYLYVAGSTRGIYIVDVRDPLNPALADRGGLPNPVPTSTLGGFRIGPIFALGNLLVVSSMDDTGGFATLDISDPLHPTLLASQTRDLPKFYAICLAGNRIITAVRGPRARMSVWDISDPFRITLIDDSMEVPEQLYCTTQDEFVFQGAEPEAVKIDVSTPGAYRIVGRGSLGVANPDHGQVTAFGNLVFVGNDHGTGSAFMPHQLGPDDTPPRVSMVHPLDGDGLQAVTTRVGLVFTDNVELDTIHEATFVVRPVGGAPLAGRYTAQGNIVNFTPAQALAPDTLYEVVVPAGGIEDWAGNPITEAFRSTFRTASVAADGVGAPRVRLVPAAPSTPGMPVALRAQAEGQGTMLFQWSFGDGTPWTEPSASPAVEHSYAAAGNYSVVVRVTNGRGWSSASQRVAVVERLDASLASSSSTLAYDAARQRVYAVNRDHGSVSAVDAETLVLLWESPVGESPRSLTLGGDGLIWVAVRDAGELVRLDPADGRTIERIPTGRGSRPVAVASDPGGRFVAASLEATGELVLFDQERRERRVPLGAHPGGLSIDAEGVILISRFLGPGDEGIVWQVTTDGEGAPIGEAQEWVLVPDRSTIDGEDRSRGVPNYLGAPARQPGTGRVWIPATNANVLRGLARDGEPLNHENTVRALALRLDLASGRETWPRLDFNDRALPTDIVFSPLGNWVWVTLQGSNLVTVVDAFTGANVSALTDVGHAPEALVLSPDGRRVFVHSFLSRSLEVFDAGPWLDGEAVEAGKLASVSLVGQEVLDPTVLRGKRIFYNAADPRMSLDGYIACASCHLDGGHDGLTWDFTDRGEGLRNTIDLRGRAGLGHGPLHWTANFDEVQDFENDIRLHFRGTGFLTWRQWGEGTRADPLGDPKAGLSPDLDALAAYVSSLTAYPQSPWRNPDGTMTARALRGQVLFDAAGCATCHSGSELTDSGSEGPTLPRHDIGTLAPSSGMRLGSPIDGIDTPTLRSVWASPPYLHDGSAPTLRDVFARHDPTGAHDLGHLTPEEVVDLLRYLLELE